MLLWQRQNSDFLKRRFFFYSIVCHLVACFFLLFFYKEQRHKLLLDLSFHPTQAQVRLLPLSMAKPVGQQRIGTKQGKKKGGSASAISVKKKETVSRSATSLASRVAATSVKKSSQPEKAKTKKNVNDAKKSLNSKKVSTVKTNEKIVEKKHMAVLEKTVTQQEKVSQTSNHDASMLAKKMETHSPEEFSVKPQGAISSDQAAGQEYIYLTRQELDAFQISQKLQECLFEVWTIPMGMPSTTVCEAVLTIGWDGVIVATDYTKKSSILLYDLSVQEALEQAQFPREVWGKQITVIFKP